MMEVSSIQLTQLKTIEVEILRIFIRVCDQLGLRYYVLYGTLLGAVRHKGFIPWDDDIDVGMLREDYDRFLAEGQALLPDHLFMQTNETDPQYVNSFLKIRDSRTTFVETSVKNCEIHHGVFIDVFPLDYCIADLRKEKMAMLKNRVYMERLRGELYIENLPLYSKCLRAVLKAIYPSASKVIQKREDLFKNEPKGAYLANSCGSWGLNEIVPVPTDWYGEGTMVTFEGIQVRAPKEYKKCLEREYGDYMQLPPPEEQIPHHYVEAIDLDVGYQEYRNGKRKKQD